MTETITSSQIKQMYYTTRKENFPENFQLLIGDEVIDYQKQTWNLDGEEIGLRYGENPHQTGAYYTPKGINNLGINFIRCGRKAPSLINVKDVIHGAQILKYFTGPNGKVNEKVATMKHHNPAGFADSFIDSYEGDWRSALGSAVVFNTPFTEDTAEEILSSWGLSADKRYFIEVIAAPSFERGALKRFDRAKGEGKAKNLRLAEISNLENLPKFRGDESYPIVMGNPDNSIFFQEPSLTRIKTIDDFFLNLEAEKDGKTIRGEVTPSEAVQIDAKEGWYVSSNVRSNDVHFYKNGRLIAVGTGEQERIGAAEQAIDKAYKKIRDRSGYNELEPATLEDKIKERCADLKGSVLVSDAFFPFRDVVDKAAEHGIAGVIMPGGAFNDYEVIQACNEHGIPLLVTGERSFAHF